MTGEVIKSFLVSLGFGVDDSSLAKFNKALASAALKVTALYASTKVAAAGIAYSITKVSEGFEEMGYEYKLIAPAINKALILRQEMFKAYSAAGVNLVKVIQASVKLNLSLAKTKYAFEAVYKSVASRFFETITKQSDLFRKRIYDNMPKIQATLERLINFIFKMLEAVTALGLRLWSILTRVYDFFVLLDKATGGWSTRILAIIALWELLNAAFLETPLGLLLAGLLGILALYDDFQTFQEGGESLFDWSSFIPVINAVSHSLDTVHKFLEDIFQALSDVVLAFMQLYQGDTSGFWDSIKNAGQDIVNIFKDWWEIIKGIGGSIGALAGWAGHFTGGATVPQGGTPQASLGANTNNHSNTNNNINVQQQTNLHVQSTADANAIGRASSSAQAKQNADLARNLPGAVRAGAPGK